jgi:hypothetical protein
VVRVKWLGLQSVGRTSNIHYRNLCESTRRIKLTDKYGTCKYIK